MLGSWIRALLGRAARTPDGPRVPARFYTRADCPLCDAMRARLEAHPSCGRLALETVDVDADPALARRFGAQVPVLEVGGRVAHKARIRAGTFPARVERLARLWEERGAPRAREDPADDPVRKYADDR